MILSKEYPNNKNYIIYSDGRIYSKCSNIFLKPKIDKTGYANVTFCDKGKRRYFRVHQLVAQMFIPNPNNYEQVKHLDENKLNNDVSNLEWSTSFLNSNYGTRNARIGIALSKPVIMLDKETKQPLRRFGSVADAERWLGKHDGHCNIVAACNGRRNNAYGFCWQYVDK